MLLCTPTILIDNLRIFILSGGSAEMNDAPNDLIAQAASELIERHGPHALIVAKERATQVAKSAGSREHDIALRLLTKVEQLLGDSSLSSDRRP
jgi:hypothetical protein